MQLHSFPRRSFNPQPVEQVPVNWRRGMFRVWILVSAAWIMSWAIYLIMSALEGKIGTGELLEMPVLLFGPPVALLIFGTATGWAFRGFKVDELPSED
jgi:hypothetical protein